MEEETDDLSPATKMFFSVLRSLSSDLGLFQIVPYLCRFIYDTTAKNLKNLVRLKAVMRATWALLKNPQLTVEPYLHQLMPAILTCLVGKQLCEDPMEDDHWSLREYSAQLVSFVCERYTKYSKDIQPRVVNTLIHNFLDPTKSLPAHYGAVKGIIALGPRPIQLVLIPNVSAYIRLLDAKLSSNANPRLEMEGKRLRELLLEISCHYLITAAQYHKDVEELLKLQEETQETPRKTTRTPTNNNTNSNNMEIVTEPSTKRRKMEHLKSTAVSPIHQTILFHELNDICNRFLELKRVFGKHFLEAFPEWAVQFYTQNEGETL